MNVRVVGVHGGMDLCGVADQTFVVKEGDIGRSCVVSFVVCNDFYTIVLPHTHATREYI